MQGRAGHLNKLVAGNIKRLRTKQGLSQEELAAKCNIHRNHIGFIERSEISMTITTLEKVAKALGVSADSLLRNAKD